jgi:hypothetical protein
MNLGEGLPAEFLARCFSGDDLVDPFDLFSSVRFLLGQALKLRVVKLPALKY